MNSEKPKTPQEELEELLRQAGGQPGKMPAAGPLKAPRQSLSLAGKLPKISKQWLLIGGLAIVLLIATLFFVSGLSVQKSAGIEISGEEQDIRLTVGKKVYEGVDPGFRVALRPGKHEIRAIKDGFLEFVGTAQVAKNQYTPVTITLLPIPELKELVAGTTEARLNADGLEVSYLEPGTGTFKTQVLESGTVADLFRGTFSNINKVIWSNTGQAALVQFNGDPNLGNVIDNREAPGRYLSIGEKPSQAPTKFIGITTWLFDDANKNAGGWQPVRLSDNVRQVAFSPDGGRIIYIYEGADGEYSLISAQPDGLEWERIITTLPRFSNPELIWGDDSRFLVIIDGNKVYVADLLSKALEQVFNDWVVGTEILFSPSGVKVAYMGGTDITKLKVYDLLSRETKEVPDTVVSTASKFVWLNNLDVLVADENQTFKRIEMATGKQSLLPFAGTQITSLVEKLGYSSTAHVLMVVAGGTVYYMRV